MSLIRNVTISGRRKVPRKNIYVEVVPEIIKLDHVLKELDITREQLIDVAILVGTDFNPDGVKGIGPKTALKLIKKYGSIEEDIPELENVKFPAEPKRIREIFLNPKVTDNYKLEWGEPNIEGVVNFLCRERDFSENRVRNALSKMTAGLKEAKSKTTLETWFG
jgi:flap endonuclease-1